MTNVITEKITEWLWQIAVKKGVSFVVKMIISLITGVKVAPLLQQLGITVDTTQLALGASTLLGFGLTMLQNWIKIKFGVKWL